MTREELSKLITERNEDVAKNDIPKVINPIMDIYQKGFMTGMDVGKELVIEKAYQWLRENIDAYSKVVIVENSIPSIVLTEDFEYFFKKAMEE